MSQRELELLVITALPEGSGARQTLYRSACGRYSEKKALQTMQQLHEYGLVQLFRGRQPYEAWLTDAGRTTLEMMPMCG